MKITVYHDLQELRRKQAGKILLQMLSLECIIEDLFHLIVHPSSLASISEILTSCFDEKDSTSFLV